MLGRRLPKCRGERTTADPYGVKTPIAAMAADPLEHFEPLIRRVTAETKQALGD